MSDPTYSASKSRSNRPGWSVSFRHPLRRDARGKPGLKIRRGLGVTDEAEADRLVVEMNTLLADQTWWNANKRTDAERKFTRVIVAAFYDEIQAGLEDPESLREELIALPSAEDGYSRLLFVGTTGAGKTSLLRQLIGSDPDKDRFPSTAPAKTTIADIEVVQSEGDYQSVVTFFTEFQIQANIEECIVDACLAASQTMPDDKVADRLLNHRDQKFRLSYILGSWDKASVEDDDDDFSFETEMLEADEEASDLSSAERVRNHEVLDSFIDRIRALSAEVKTCLADDLDIETGRVVGPDREAAEQLEENFEAYLADNEGFHELVQDMLDCIRQRFELIKDGLERHHSGWPKRWQFVGSDREHFITQIRWFASNHWRQFGRLLTPMVNGIRVKGPLFPSFMETPSRLVLIDGQGLGHTPDSSSSVTTHITRRFDHVDVILLVDNAQQPMQAAPLSVLRFVADSGHSEKLAVAFTHFDQIRGPSLRNRDDKRDHVMASVRNALSNLRDVLGVSMAKSIEDGINDRCFMLGGVDQNLARLPARAAEYMRAELAKLMKICENAIQPPPPPDACPVYDPTGIYFVVREATLKFQGPWLARLGIAAHEGVGKEHWARVKALNRRIAGELDVEYGNLQPVADFVTRMTESVSRFLYTPIAWTHEPEDDHERRVAIARIQRIVSAEMHKLALQRLVDRPLSEWRDAYELRGSGSTFTRARRIRGIYDEAVPVPDAVMPPPAKQLSSQVRRIVIDAIEASGGEVELSKNDSEVP